MPSPHTRRRRARRRLSAAPLGAASCLLAAALAAQAQTTVAPDAGSLLRESRQQPAPPPQLPQVEQPKLLQDTGIKVRVQRFEIAGATRIKVDELQPLLADLVGQELGFAQLQAAADRIAGQYRRRGLHATVVLPEQTLDGGVVRLLVVEGRFGRLRVESAVPEGRRVPHALTERMLGTRQQPGTVIDTRALERATLIANELPGVRVSSLLAAGSNPGETDIVARVDARPFFGGSVSADNADPRATGSTKVNAALAVASPAGIGDQADLFLSATRGKRYARAAYGVPLGDDGLRVAVNASALWYELVGEFKSSGGEGKAQTAGAALNYPVVRSVDANLYAGALVDWQRLKNDSDAGNLSNKRVATLTLSLNGDAIDTLGGGGANVGGVQLTGGHLDLGRNDADENADRAGADRRGGFAKLGANVARLQRLSASGNLWLSLTGQLAFKNLDSGQKYSLGGITGVRAYPALEASGDHALLGTVEYRHQVGDALQLSAFYDHGRIRRDRDPYAGSANPNTFSLKGAGIGADLQAPYGVLLRAVLAARVGHNPARTPNGDDSDGTRRNPRLWVSASVPF